MSPALDINKNDHLGRSLQFYIEAIGLAAPGLPDWQTASAVLRCQQTFVAAELPPYQPERLPANERRRATLVVRQAFRAAEDAIRQSTCDATELASVFASSDADMNVLHRICSALAEPSRLVSPTDFHNSVHNAAAGYWSIATRARRTSTSIGAHDSTVAAGLLEAAALLFDEDAVLLVMYDVPQPKPLLDQHPITSAVSVALVITRERIADSRASLRLTLEPSHDIAPTTCGDPELDALRLSNPAARALPMLQVLAQRRSDRVWIEAVGGCRLRIDIETLA